MSPPDRVVAKIKPVSISVPKEGVYRYDFGTMFSGWVKLKMEGKIYKEGDFISLNGSTGEVYDGRIATVDPELSGDFGKLMKLSDKKAKLYVRTNADTPLDAQVARDFGAQGIGLCRTEHMFFGDDKIVAMREMILADPEGSIVAEMVNTGTMTEAGSWLVEGIGEDFVPSICDLDLVTKAYSISDGEAFEIQRALLEREGIIAGSSTGTLLAAALRYCREQRSEEATQNDMLHYSRFVHHLRSPVSRHPPRIYTPLRWHRSPRLLRPLSAPLWPPGRTVWTTP